MQMSYIKYQSFLVSPKINYNLFVKTNWKYVLFTIKA